MRGEVESTTLRWATRAGLAANGLIHILVAWLAVRVALGSRERADQAGALQAIAAEPFGRLLLWLVVAGFAAVVAWRIREALWGFRYVRDSGARTKKRLFSAMQAVIFAGLTLLGTRAAAGSSTGNGGQGITAIMLQNSAGRVLVVVVGVAVGITGVFMGYRGVKKAFTEDMDFSEASSRARTVAMRAGQFGSVAKGVAFTIIGLLVVVAGLRYQPERAEGLDAALKTLAVQPYGSVLLVAVAAGLASFGLFCFFDARFHRV